MDDRAAAVKERQMMDNILAIEGEIEQLSLALVEKEEEFESAVEALEEFRAANQIDVGYALKLQEIA